MVEENEFLKYDMSHVEFTEKDLKIKEAIHGDCIQPTMRRREHKVIKRECVNCNKNIIVTKERINFEISVNNKYNKLSNYCEDCLRELNRATEKEE